MWRSILLEHSSHSIISNIDINRHGIEDVAKKAQIMSSVILGLFCGPATLICVIDAFPIPSFQDLVDYKLT